VVTRRFPVFQQTLQQWRECDTIGYCEVNLADVLIARRRKLAGRAAHARAQKPAIARQAQQSSISAQVHAVGFGRMRRQLPCRRWLFVN
jgi:hypothetical protein